MHSRRQFLTQSSLGMLSFLAFPIAASAQPTEFEGLIVHEDEGETFMLRNGTTILRIKITKLHGSKSLCFLSESILPGEAIPVHKHSNEDEMIFLHKGVGVFTMGEQEYVVEEGAVAIVPKGVWHGLRNTGKENIEMRFAYTPSGFEGYFREVGTPVGKPFVKKSQEEKRIIAHKWGMTFKV